MRILIVTAPPWASTGYGVQGASLSKRLLADGHKVAWLPMGGYGAGYMRHEGIEFLPPALNDERGNDTIIAHAATWRADIVLTIYDAWILKNYGGANHRWVAWAPVDGDPYGRDHVATLKQSWRQIAMSRHGEERMKEAGFNPTYIPLGFEDTFRPDTKSGQVFRREVMGVPDDAFVFGSVGLNYRYPGRKGFDRLIEAFAQFQAGKENVHLYLHTSPLANESLDLNSVCDLFGLKDNVQFARPYPHLLGYTPDAMRGVYNAMDCMVLATQGEGFGVPLIEAQACGRPVIATDCTSSPELVGQHTGILVPPVTRYLTPGYYYYYLIDVPQLVAAMEELYAEHELEPGSRYPAGRYRAARFPNLREICHKSVQQYHWDAIYANYWRPFLQDCEREIAARSLNAVASSEQRSAATVQVLADRVRKTDGPLANVQAEEATLLTLDHPGIVKPIASGTDEFGRFYMDMPRYETSLDKVDCAEWTEERKQHLLVALAEALNYLHAKGIAHRDVHPSNVVLRGEQAALIDFSWAAACPGRPCVDFAPWLVPEQSPANQANNPRGYHTIVAHVRGISLDDARATGLPGIPYQAIDGAGERDCALRWDIMQPDVKGKRVLDVGCNLGYFAGRAMQEGAAFALGIDHDAATIREAKKLYPDVLFSVGDVANGALPTEDFDVAFVLSVLQHLPKPEDTLGRLLGIAKTLYVEIPRDLQPILPSTINVKMLGVTERKRPLVRIDG